MSSHRSVLLSLKIVIRLIVDLRAAGRYVLQTYHGSMMGCPAVLAYNLSTDCTLGRVSLDRRRHVCSCRYAMFLTIRSSTAGAAYCGLLSTDDTSGQCHRGHNRIFFYVLMLDVPVPVLPARRVLARANAFVRTARWAVGCKHRIILGQVTHTRQSLVVFH